MMEEVWSEENRNLKNKVFWRSLDFALPCHKYSPAVVFKQVADIFVSFLVP